MTTKAKEKTPQTSETPTRDKLREMIFNSGKPTSEEIVFFGQTIELRQPSVAEIEAFNADGQKLSNTVAMLIRYAFVPGTDQRVFEQADMDSLQAMPWGPDFTRATTAITKLIGVDTDGATKN